MTGPRGTAALAVHGVRVPRGRATLARDLGRLAARAARMAGRDVDLSFALLADGEMRALNRRALGHDHATDVLSWLLRSEPVLWGEVVLGADTARREADRRGHAAYHELMLYAVHGVLHLLGHDDHAPKARARMRRAERAVLGALGLPAVFGSGRAPVERRGRTR